MSASTDARRRRLGMISLTIAALMLLGGQTVFESSLRGLGFLVYWLACFLFTITSIAIAILDIRALRRQSRHLQEEMLEDSFGDLHPKPEDEDSGGKHSS